MKKYLLLALFLIGGRAYAAPAFVQSQSNACLTAVTSCAIAFGSNTTTGNAILVGVRYTAGRTITVTDSCSDTYGASPDASGTFAAGASGLAIISAKNIASCADTVTVAVSGGGAAIIFGMVEVSGLLTSGTIFDKGNNTSGTGTTATTGSITTTNSAQFVFTIMGTDHANTSGTFAVTAPWTQVQNNSGFGWGNSDRATSGEQANVGGTFNGNFTWTSSANWGGVIASYFSVAPSVTGGTNAGPAKLAGPAVLN